MEIDQYEQRNQRQWYKKDIASYDFMLSPSASNPSTLHQDNHYPYKPNQQAPASQPTANMQFIITILALATAATALPATSQVVDATGFDNYHGEQVLISLPTGCTNADLASKWIPEVSRVSIPEADHGQSAFCTWSVPLVPAAPLSSSLVPTLSPTCRALVLPRALLPTSMSARAAFPSR
jgi:hypothetical protein